MLNLNAAPRSSTKHSRNRARRFAMQALYQWQMTKQDIGLINAQFLTAQDMRKADIAYFQELLQQTLLRLDVINETIAPHLDRAIEQIDPVESAILWLSAYELLYRPDVPYRVILNEAVELAKLYGAEQGHRFINGVLDKTAHQVRSDEIKTSGHKKYHA